MLEDLIGPGNSWVSCHGLVMRFLDYPERNES